MMLRYQLPMQVPMSLVWGASGRAILAFLDAAQIARIHAAEGSAPVSGEKLPARRTLDRDLAAIRARGYEVTQGQKIAGAVGIAAPVFGAGGKVLGSICVTVPDTRIAPKDYPRLGERVRATAAQVSAALGAPGDVRAIAGVPFDKLRVRKA
jgi:DNA-binding IclR family transcriptional regulator